MLPRATEIAMAGHIWRAGRYLPTAVIGYSVAITETGRQSNL